MIKRKLRWPRGEAEWVVVFIVLYYLAVFVLSWMGHDGVEVFPLDGGP